VARQVLSFYGTYRFAALLRDTWCYKHDKQEHQAYHFSFVSKTPGKKQGNIFNAEKYILYSVHFVEGRRFEIPDKLPFLQEVEQWSELQPPLPHHPLPRQTHPNAA